MPNPGSAVGRAGWGCGDAGGRRLYVELNGTTGTLASVNLTANVVDIARSEHPNTAVYVLHDISLTGVPDDSGGTLYEPGRGFRRSRVCRPPSTRTNSRPRTRTGQTMSSQTMSEQMTQTALDKIGREHAATIAYWWETIEVAMTRKRLHNHLGRSKILRAMLAKYHGVPADIPLRVVHAAAVQVQREH